MTETCFFAIAASIIAYKFGEREPLMSPLINWKENT